MRPVLFEIFARSGIPGTPTTGTVADLLESIPYLLALGVIPPLLVVNDLLRRGISDAGMSGGCRWEAFEVSLQEWTEARDTLEAASKSYRYVEPPQSVTSFEHWHAWLYEFLYSVPADEHRRLTEQDADLGRAIENAISTGDEAGAVELHLKRIQVNEELSALLMKHLRRSR
jgi:hypothetical protein